jgi:signal transduction histidine kinase
MHIKKPALLRWLAWFLAALSLALVVAGFVVSWRLGQRWLSTHMVFAPVTTITYALIGTLVAARQPRNPIGWIFGAVGVFAGLTWLSSSYKMVGQSMLPGFEVAQWLNLWIWIPTSILPLTFVLLLFPNGRLPSPRWWPIAWSAGLGLAAFIVSTALHPRPPIEPIAPANPFGIPSAVGVLNLLANSTYILLPVGAFGSLAALVVRFRRSRGIEREQIKWLAYGSTIAILCIWVMSAWWAARPFDRVAYELTLGSVWVALTIIVIAAGIAILRHGLYNIDLLINRTLVYGALSAGVVGLYVLLVGALGALFQSSGNLVIALLATGVAALLAQPLRARLQRSVNRLMYGERDDPYTVLSHLSQQLKTTLAPTAVLPNIAQAVAQTLKLPYVAIALQQNGELVIAAEYRGKETGRYGDRKIRTPGDEETPGAKLPISLSPALPISLSLVYQGESVGQLLVAPRAPGETFTPAERRLLEDIALQAGVAAHAVRLTVDLQRSRERLVTAREEERRRLRRDLHDGLGPQLASLTLTLAAARALLRHDIDAADMLLQELSAHTQAAIADIRRVVYDLRPPALDDLGLVLALREQAANYTRAGLQITIDAPDHLPPLPAAVEVAAYRITQEALTNVVRHAQARTCAVCMTLNGALDVEVRDDGVGLPPGGRAGVGLTSMRERTVELGGTCVIESAPGRGTCIHVQLPLHQEGV